MGKIKLATQLMVHDHERRHTTRRAEPKRPGRTCGCAWSREIRAAPAGRALILGSVVETHTQRRPAQTPNEKPAMMFPRATTMAIHQALPCPPGLATPVGGTSNAARWRALPLRPCHRLSRARPKVRPKGVCTVRSCRTQGNNVSTFAYE